MIEGPRGLKPGFIVEKCLFYYKEGVSVKRVWVSARCKTQSFLTVSIHFNSTLHNCFIITILESFLGKFSVGVLQKTTLSGGEFFCQKTEHALNGPFFEQTFKLKASRSYRSPVENENNYFLYVMTEMTL